MIRTASEPAVTAASGRQRGEGRRPSGNSKAIASGTTNRAGQPRWSQRTAHCAAADVSPRSSTASTA